MQLSAIALTEEGALDALYQREHFPIGTKATLIESGPMPDDLTEWTFDFDLPFERPVWSMEHPYEGAPLASSMVKRPLLAIAVAGYASMHAPTHEDGQKIGNMSMFMRHFDRKGGRPEALSSYEGCMTGGRR
jgi:hypothetical protein